MSELENGEQGETVVTEGAEADAGTTGKKGAKAGDSGKKDGTETTITKTLAEGGEATKTPVTAIFPDDWRDQVAEDKKDLKTLARLGSPKDLWKAHKALAAKFDGGDLVKLPGAKATKEERAEFFKALGVPENAAEYLDKIKLSNNRILGDADRPVIESFAAAVLPAGATPDVVSAAADWWFDFEQARNEQRAQEDADYRVESEVALKQELGGGFTRVANAIGTLFEGAPPAVMDLLLNGRSADGRLLGDHPEIVKWLGSVALEMNPAAPMHAPDGDNLKALNDEIAELRKLSGNDKSEYWEGPLAKKHQARYKELLDMRDKLKARAA